MADRSADQYKKWSEHRILAGILTILQEWFEDVLTKAITNVVEMQGLINDTTLRTLRLDSSTHAIETITYEHHEIHSGSHFSAKGYETGLANGATVEFVITTPDTSEEIHMTFSFTFTLGGILDVYRSPTTVAGGSAVTPLNSNENSAHVSALTVVKDPASIGGDGTLIEGHLGGANRQAGSGGREDEIILKRNTAYLFRFTSTANSNSLDYNGSWYEHTPKN